MSSDASRHSDARLFAMLREGPDRKEEAFAELYRRHSARVWTYCLKIMGDRHNAEDMFQGTFLRFLNAAEQEREMTNVPGFLLRIARNLCLNSKAKMKPVSVPIEEMDLADHSTPIETKELEGLIAMALDLLPDEQREAFVLQAYNGLSYKEISEVIEQPVSTVRNRVVRGKRRVREILAPYLVDHRT